MNSTENSEKRAFLETKVVSHVKIFSKVVKRILRMIFKINSENVAWFAWQNE